MHPLATTHAPPATMHTPSNHTHPCNHAHPPATTHPQQPCMPPTTMHTPQQPCMPPSNHACPPPSNHACPPTTLHPWQPHTSPATTHTPLWTEFLTHASENITLPQTSFAGGNNTRMHCRRMRTTRFSGRFFGGVCQGECLPHPYPCGQTDACENITFRQTAFVGGKNVAFPFTYSWSE